jgi:cytochrome c556
LTPVLGKALEAPEPAWETIQKQTREFAELAAALGKNTPPRGSKESWEKLTSAYAAAAAGLDRAAQGKDRDAALTAHRQLEGSCKACHNAHRMGGR